MGVAKVFKTMQLNYQQKKKFRLVWDRQNLLLNSLNFGFLGAHWVTKTNLYKIFLYCYLMEIITWLYLFHWFLLLLYIMIMISIQSGEWAGARKSNVVTTTSMLATMYATIWSIAHRLKLVILHLLLLLSILCTFFSELIVSCSNN